MPVTYLWKVRERRAGKSRGEIQGPWKNRNRKKECWYIGFYTANNKGLVGSRRKGT